MVGVHECSISMESFSNNRWKILKESTSSRMGSASVAKKLALSQAIGGMGAKWFQIREIAHFSEALLDSCTSKGSHCIVIASKLSASPCPKRCASNAQADYAVSPQAVDVSQKHAGPYCTYAAEQSQQLNKLPLESAKSYPC